MWTFEALIQMAYLKTDRRVKQQNMSTSHTHKQKHDGPSMAYHVHPYVSTAPTEINGTWFFVQ